MAKNNRYSGLYLNNMLIGYLMLLLVTSVAVVQLQMPAPRDTTTTAESRFFESGSDLAD